MICCIIQIKMINLKDGCSCLFVKVARNSSRFLIISSGLIRIMWKGSENIRFRRHLKIQLMFRTNPCLGNALKKSNHVMSQLVISSYQRRFEKSRAHFLRYYIVDALSELIPKMFERSCRPAGLFECIFSRRR